MIGQGRRHGFGRASRRALGAALALWLPACLDAAGPDDTADALELASVDQAIILGRTSGAEQDSVVALQLGPTGVCTGTLVAPNLILTARHCLSYSDTDLSCANSGEPIYGGKIYGDRVPEDLVVYAGRQRDALLPVARGLRFVHDGAQNLCNHDIAFVVLDRPILGLPIAPLRMRRPTTVGEPGTAVGWGLTEDSQLPDKRLQRPGVIVRDVGPSANSPANHLLVGEAICSGDSGGPLLSASGAVIGVVSYGGNGVAEPASPEQACSGDSTVNVYTRVSGFPTLVDAAFRLVGARMLAE